MGLHHGGGHAVERVHRDAAALGDAGTDRCREHDGVPTDTARELRVLKRKNRELEETIEILKAATSFFARESDPRHR